jgi:hypothetical protein
MAVAMLRGKNIYGKNVGSMGALLSEARKIPLKGVKWIDYEGASGNLFFTNPDGISEDDIRGATRTKFGMSAAVRTLDQLKLSLQAFDQTLAKMGKNVDKRNSNVEAGRVGIVKAGICFIFSNTQVPKDVTYPKVLGKDVRVVGAVDRDVQFLWERKNGSYGEPNGEVEDWLGAMATSRAYSIVYRMVRR